MEKYTIYGLREPGGPTRYIGQTRTALARRLSGHKTNARTENRPVSDWLRSVKTVEIFEIEGDIDGRNLAYDRERFHIESHQSGGEADLNIANASGATARWHGTSGGYSNHKCRCEKCRAAWAERIRRSKESRRLKPVPPEVHGTQNGYGNYGCRCTQCTQTWNSAALARMRRRKAGVSASEKIGEANRESGSLSYRQAQEIRSKWEKGLSQAEIAVEFGVSKAVCSKVIRGVILTSPKV